MIKQNQYRMSVTAGNKETQCDIKEKKELNSENVGVETMVRPKMKNETQVGCLLCHEVMPFSRLRGREAYICDKCTDEEVLPFLAKMIGERDGIKADERKKVE